MANVSRPLIALLVGTVAFFALWTVALKPSSSTTTAASQGVGAYQSAIDKAHRALATASAASVAHGGTIPATPATPTAAAKPARAAHAGSQAKAAAKPSSATAHVAPAGRRRLNPVDRALAAHKVVALLFYNPTAADDRVVDQELAAISTHGGQVVKLAVPLSQLSHYTVVTNQVPVSSSPTLVLIDRRQQATTIVGFADSFEIAQRVADALAVR